MTTDNGLLLAIEGIDGAGKNTLTGALEAELTGSGRTVARMAFPRYGTFHADVAAAALRGRFGPVVDSPEAMALLFALDRAQAAGQLAAARARADVVIVDRYVASNAAYTCARLGLDRLSVVIEWIEQMEHGELAVPRPDAYLLLPTPPQVARERADSRAAADATRELDAYERDARLQADTAAAYAQLAERQWTAPWLAAPTGVSPEQAAAVLAGMIRALE